MKRHIECSVGRRGGRGVASRPLPAPSNPPASPPFNRDRLFKGRSLDSARPLLIVRRGFLVSRPRGEGRARVSPARRRRPASRRRQPPRRRSRPAPGVARPGTGRRRARVGGGGLRRAAARANTRQPGPAFHPRALRLDVFRIESTCLAMGERHARRPAAPGALAARRRLRAYARSRRHPPRAPARPTTESARASRRHGARRWRAGRRRAPATCRRHAAPPPPLALPLKTKL